MSMDADDVKGHKCGACGMLVEMFAPNTSYEIVGGLYFHPACAPATEDCSEVVDLGDRMRYHLDVIDVLTRGKDATRETMRPAMDEDELDEMVDAYAGGETARAFALRLCSRDVSHWERASDPYPQRQFPTAEND